MRKIISFIILLCCAIGLLACNKAEISEKNNNTTTKVENEKDVDTSESEEEIELKLTDIALGGRHTVGLTNQGTVVAYGDDSQAPGVLDVSEWEDVVAVGAGRMFTKMAQ